SGADAGTIYEFDTAEEQFNLRSTYGMSNAEVQRLVVAIHDERVGLHNSPLGAAALQRQPVQIPDMRLQAWPTGERPVRHVLEDIGYRAMAIVPMLRDGDIVGCLTMRRKLPGDFPPETISLLQ